MFRNKVVTTGLFVSLVCLLSVLGMGAYLPQSCFGGEEEKCNFEDYTFRCSLGKIQVCEDPGIWKTTEECLSGQCVNGFECVPKPCTHNSECPEAYFCNTEKGCLRDGSCTAKEDCLNESNNWSCFPPECQKDDNYTYCETATEFAFCSGCICGNG